MGRPRFYYRSGLPVVSRAFSHNVPSLVLSPQCTAIEIRERKYLRVLSKIAKDPSFAATEMKMKCRLPLAFCDLSRVHRNLLPSVVYDNEYRTSN